MTRWDHSDAWILAAVYVSRDQAPLTLSHVIKAADGLNHAVPMRREVRQALERFLAVGIVEFDDATLCVTLAHAEAIRRCVKRARSHFGIVDQIFEWLVDSVALPAPEVICRLSDEQERALDEAYE